MTAQPPGSLYARLAQTMSDQERAALIRLATGMAVTEENADLAQSNDDASGPASSSPFPQEADTDDDDDSREQIIAPKGNGHAAGSTSSLPHNKHTNTEGEGRAGNGEIGKDGEGGFNQTPAQRGLPIAVKRRILELYAQFHRLSDVYAIIQTEFGLTVDKRTLASYNPENRECRIGRNLRAFYDAQRKLYTEEAGRVAVSHQAHRLRLIERLIDKATTAKEFNAAIKGLELAAKEMGQLAQHVKHEGVVSHVHGSVDDARAEVAMRLKAMMESGALFQVALPNPTTPSPTQGTQPMAKPVVTVDAEVVPTEGTAPPAP
jgi:hypothetical protein